MQEESVPNTFDELVEKYRKEYEWKFLKKFPEHCQWKLREGIKQRQV